MGRRSAMKRADISCPYPDDQQLLVDMCRLATIMEESAAALYSRTTSSLNELYLKADQIYTSLRDFFQRAGLGSLGPRQGSNATVAFEMCTSLMLNLCKWLSVTCDVVVLN